VKNLPSLLVGTLLVIALGANGSAESLPSPMIPDPSRCSVPQRTPEQLEDLRRFVEKRGPTRQTQPALTSVPEGTPADPATRSAIATLVDTFFACVAAGEPDRAYLLLSDAYLVSDIDDPDEAVAYVAGLAESTPTADAPGERALYAGPWDVQMLPDGSVAAAVWLDSEDEHPARGVTAIWLFVFQGGEWRMDGTITTISVPATPSSTQENQESWTRVNVADLVGWPEVITPRGATPDP
jgi:hypothetical protein